MAKKYVMDLSNIEKSSKGSVIWKTSEGRVVKFINDDGVIEEIKIEKFLDYKNIIVSYKNKKFKVNSSNFKYGIISYIIGKDTRNRGHIYKIGDVVSLNSDKFEVIGLTTDHRNSTAYELKCLKCGDIVIKTLSDFKYGCVVCCGKKSKLGYNTIYDLKPELLKWINEDDAKKYTCGSKEYINTKCPDCGAERKLQVYTFTNNKFNCGECGDNISYGEKFMVGLLNSLDIKFKREFGKKDEDWCKLYRYDFYIEFSGKRIICEVMGVQHYESSRLFFNGYSFEEISKRDKLKKELALSNGINFYIELDARKSEYNWIKNSILNSGLLDIIEKQEKDIDWEKVCNFMNTPYLNYICNYWKENKDYKSTKEIAFDLNISYGGLVRKLLEANKVYSWLNYDGSEQKRKTLSKVLKGKLSKPYKAYKKDSGEFIGVFNGAIEFKEYAKINYNMDLNINNINSAIGKKFSKSCKGFIFERITKEEYEELKL